MVLDVYVEGCEERFSCANSGFAKFKCEIFRGWNEDLGKLYEENFRYLWQDFDTSIAKNFDFNDLIKLHYEREKGVLGQNIKKILDEFDKPYNEGMKLFYGLGDNVVSPKECKIILDSFERVNAEKFDKSDQDMNEWLVESYDTWKIMLKYAVDNNVNLICG